MKLSDLTLMYDELSHIVSELEDYQKTLEEREWSNFYSVLNPQLCKFEWMLDTIDYELRSWD